MECLCDHLTSFGSGFLAAPTPIDFDKVFMELSRLGETGNVAVLATIISIFLLYIIAVVLARRGDKRDELKVLNNQALYH